ncbi:ER membrane protein complex subunit 1 [Caerostris extrusa]|uniref:ER membrane protein complex subunit 1 n=1 Tax=Caerostris extrusa TaxID=172846 RepID=A0AAV4XTF8_CAEEX|nr:ER membrane protein complex subunit 1 [Caerostris extrusa]
MTQSRYFTFLVNLIIVLIFIAIAHCLYEDQVGKFDWRQQYIGKVKFTYIDPTIGGSQKFVVATEENVIACLSTRTGSIIWRQILESGDTGSIDAMSEDGDLITISGGGRFLRSWDPNTGVLLWETSFPNAPIEDALNYFQISSSTKEIIKIEALPKQHAKILLYSYTRGSLKTSNIIPIPWYDKASDCSFISSTYFICIESSKKVLQLLSVKDSGAFIPVTLQSLGIEIEESIKEVKAISLPYQGSSDKPMLALQLEDSGMLLQILPPGIKLIKLLSKMNKITSTLIDDKLVIFTLIQSSNTYKIKTLDVESKTEVEYLDGTFSLSEDHGELELFFILPYIKKDHGVSYKMFLLFEDHSILVIHQQGRLVWTREEALSNIVASEIIDLPLSDTDANIEQEFGQPDANPLTMFLTRLKSQVFLLQSYLLHVLVGFKGDSNNVGIDKKTLTRDTFGLHKIIVVITKPGKAFGIDNLSGLIIWSHFEKKFSPFVSKEKSHFPLFVQRTTAHFPYPPVCTALGKHRNTQQSHIYSFDPITGVTIESKTLSYNVVQIMPVGTLTHYLRGILLLDSNLNVHIYPETHDIAKHKNSHFMFTAESDSGSLIGYSLAEGEGNSLKAVEVWKIKLPQPIIHVATKRPSEHVHSQGRVMGDRSVLYKYLNPNLAAAFTEGMDSIQKPFCNIYLIDVVSGLVVYSASHKRSKSPIHVVHSENWVIYSYYNEKSRRIEVSSIELFEGKSQSNTTAFSSFAPPPLPLVEHQTFIFPSTIITMADTITERGMTNKHLLIALPSGGILELPKTFLDPRRPITPLPEHREEGLIPYLPELPVMSEGIINYNQSVLRVQGIVTAPSGLESTCLVFVHGLDLFYTRVTPSKTFDILKDDFDHYLISVVLLGLVVLSYTTKRLAARKTLRAAWK